MARLAGVRLVAGCAADARWAGDVPAAVFRVVVFFAAVFPAEGFFAAVFPAGAFLAVVFPAGAFLDAVFFAGVFAVARFVAEAALAGSRTDAGMVSGATARVLAAVPAVGRAAAVLAGDAPSL